MYSDIIKENKIQEDTNYDNQRDRYASIKAKQPEIKTVYFVGCGAAQSDLFPAKYFLENNAKKLRTSIYTANNFNYSTQLV